MADKITRILLFLFGCMTVRIGLVLLAKYLPTNYLKYMRIITLIIGLGFTYIYLFGHFKSNPKIGGFGGPVWWNELRIIHGLLYILFTISSLFYNNSWIILAIDTLIGFISFINKYF
jgi:hypothetical protein